MNYSEPAQPVAGPVRVRWPRVAGLLVLVAAIGAVLGNQQRTTAPPSSTAAHAPRMHRPRGALGEPARAPALRSEHGVLGEADGAVPDGTTVFDGRVPGVANLDPALLGALRTAATAAAADGVTFTVDSGWRSAQYQQHLLDEAVSKYGSAAEAARWVAPPDRSAHVSGDAIDLGSAAAGWLGARGAQYGLCRIYGNEPWHFELRPEAPVQGCPAMYADPTHDPRMQR